MSRCFRRIAVTAPTALFVVAIWSHGTAPAQAQATAAPADKAATTPAAAPAAGEPDAQRKKDCEHFASVLAGRKGDSALLDTADVKGLAQGLPDLVTCGAVVQDSEKHCKVLLTRDTKDATTGFVPDSPYKACREGWSEFHELKAHPQGRAFMFNDVALQNCKTAKEMQPMCDGIRAAMRSGDESKCSSLGAMESICRAHIKLDKSLCQAPKGNAFFDEHGAEIAKDCATKIESKAILAKGLKSVAESGPARERELAKAALKQSDACAPLVQRAVEQCTTQGGKDGPAAEKNAPAKK